MMTIKGADRDIDDADHVDDTPFEDAQVAASAADVVERMSSASADSGNDHERGLGTHQSIHEPE